MRVRALFDNSKFEGSEWSNLHGSKPGVDFGSLLMCDELANAPLPIMADSFVDNPRC